MECDGCSGCLLGESYNTLHLRTTGTAEGSWLQSPGLSYWGLGTNELNLWEKKFLMCKRELMTGSNNKGSTCPGPGCSRHSPRGSECTESWFFLKVTGKEDGEEEAHCLPDHSSMGGTKG